MNTIPRWKIMMPSTLAVLLMASCATAQTTPPDTLDIYGGPGTLEGKFQTAEGQPDPQGWMGLDDSAVTSENWLVSTLNAANLDPGVPDNHAWWCGTDLPACAPGDSAWGYGNNWNEALGTTCIIDPTREAVVVLTGILNVDLEPGYDFLYVEIMTAAGPIQLLTLDGKHTSYDLNVSHTLLPGVFVGDDCVEVQVRLRVQTDTSWSDEDCNWPTVGAVQADNLSLAISQPDMPPYPDRIESCEPGDPSYWEPLFIPELGAGNFAQLWTGLDDMDPERDNASPQWAFINDGVIVPWLDPSYCWVKCYGPDSLSIYTGPKALRSSILSPPIAMPEDWTGIPILALDVYHDPAECYPVGLRWAMDATSDPLGESGWVETWADFVYYDAGPVYRRWEFPIDRDKVPADSRFVRIKLQAAQFGTLCWGAMDSPAPYLDNVRLQLAPSTASGAPVPSALTVSAAPNPFNPAVVIRWNLPQSEDLEVRIHDARGRLVRTLHRGPVPNGPGQVTWRGRDDAGRSVAAGVYFCRVRSATGSRLLKLTLLK